MPQPSSSLATHRPDIETSLEEFDVLAERNQMAALQVCPIYPVRSVAGTFGKIPLEQLLIDPEVKRAPRSDYNQGDWNYETATFATQEYGWEEPVDDNERYMYADYFDAEVVSANRAVGVMLRALEKRVADLIFNTTTWTGASLTTGVTNEWDDASNATPVDDVEAAVHKVYDNSGLWPNALIINRKVFRNLRQCDQIRDRIESAGAGSASRASDITVEQLAAVFDLDKIIVAGGSKNTANRGASASISQIWSDEYAMVCRVADSASDFREPCIGRTFHWADDGSQPSGRVESYRNEMKRSDVIRVRHQTDEKVLIPEAGHLLSNITT